MAPTDQVIDFKCCPRCPRHKTGGSRTCEKKRASFDVKKYLTRAFNAWAPWAPWAHMKNKEFLVNMKRGRGFSKRGHPWA